MNTTTATKISETILAIALAAEARQDAEDREQLGRANKIAAQIRVMETELKALRAQEVR